MDGTGRDGDSETTVVERLVLERPLMLAVVVLAAGAAPLFLFPGREVHVGDLVAEASVFLTVVVGLVLVARSELDRTVALPLVAALLLVELHAVTETVNEVVSYPFVTSITLEQAPLLGGMALMLVSVYRWRSQLTDERDRLERYRTTVEASSEGIFVVTDGRFELVNDAFVSYVGLSRSEVLGATPARLAEIGFYDDEAIRQCRAFGELTARGEEETEQFTTTISTGNETRTIDVRLSTIPADNSYVGIMGDIGGRMAFEQKLRHVHEVTADIMAARSEQAIRSKLVSVANDAIGLPLASVWKYDEAEGHLAPTEIPDEGQALLEEYGYEEPPPLTEADQAMEAYRNGEVLFLETYSPPSPESVQVELGATLILPLGDYGIAIFASTEPGVLDETSQYLAEILAAHARLALNRLEYEQQLREREHRLRTIVENMPVVLFAIDAEGTLTLQMGKGLEEMGLEQNEQVGQSVFEAYADQPKITDAVDRALDGESVEIVTELGERTFRVWYEPVEADGDVTTVIGVAMDVTEAQRRERGIRALHEVTREMIHETDPEEICQIAIDTAEVELDLPIAALWLRDESRAQLEPVAVSEQAKAAVDDLTQVTEDAHLWTVYEDEEPHIVQREGDGAVRPGAAELVVPMGDYGVLTSGAPESKQLDETDIVLARLLVANTRSALERAEREQTLQRRTDQMEFFNSILRHDVLNGMTVIRSRAEFLVEDTAGQQRTDAETIVHWSDDIVEMIQHVRSILDTLTGDGEAVLEPENLTETLQRELERVQATYPTVSFETAIPEHVTVRANDMLGEVLGNILTNAISHNDREGLSVSVRVEDGDDVVTVRIADNGRGVPDEVKEAIFRRGATGHVKSTGSGFGLFFADAMVTQYGGEIRVEDNEPTGAAFVVELPAADPVTDHFSS